MFIQFLWVHALLIRQSGDIQMNPGPKLLILAIVFQSICHCNLNSLTAHNYLKVSLLRAYVAIKKFDVVCLSETYLDSSNLCDDDNFNLPGCNVVRADYPSNTKKVVFASISKTLFLKRFLIFSCCKNILTLKLKLLTKRKILSLCIDLPVNPKMDLNPLQITSSFISTQLHSETHT